jgi:hypothetical protein
VTTYVPGRWPAVATARPGRPAVPGPGSAIATTSAPSAGVTASVKPVARSTWTGSSRVTVTVYGPAA